MFIWSHKGRPSEGFELAAMYIMCDVFLVRTVSDVHYVPLKITLNFTERDVTQVFLPFYNNLNFMPAVLNWLSWLFQLTRVFASIKL